MSIWLRTAVSFTIITFTGTGPFFFLAAFAVGCLALAFFALAAMQFIKY
jgi:hypothetical protein